MILLNIENSTNKLYMEQSEDYKISAVNYYNKNEVCNIFNCSKISFLLK